MIKWHINGDGNARKCHAAAANCPFGPKSVHFATMAEAQNFYEEKMMGKTVVSRDSFDSIVPLEEAPILDFNSIGLDPNEPIFSNFLTERLKSLHATMMNVKSSSQSRFEKLFSYTSNDGITEIRDLDSKRILSQVLGLDPYKLPKSLEKLGNDLGLANLENYSVHDFEDHFSGLDTAGVLNFREPGLDSPTLALKNSQMTAKLIQSWCLKNAINSRNTIEHYLASENFDTRAKEDKTVAIKEFLNGQNPGRKSALVERAKSSGTERLSFRGIKIPQMRHYEASEPRIPKSKNGEPLIYGAVVKISNEYRLVDGYHRLKFQNEHSQQKTGTYIVLYESKEKK